MSDEGEKRALGALMKALIARRPELTIQQYRTIRGQALAGDVEGLEVIEDLEARLPGKAAPVIGETVEFGLTERWYQCGVCGHPVDRGDLYCRMCGAAIIWD